MERPREELRVRVDRPRCPFCHDEVGRDDDVAVCRGCDAKHHEDCWPLEGRCGACGGATALRAVPPPAPLPASEPEPRMPLLQVAQENEVAERSDAAPHLSVARWALVDTLNVLERTRKQPLCPSWMLLIPLLWPLVYARYRARRARVRELIEHARYIARKHALDLSAGDEALLRAATIWAY